VDKKLLILDLDETLIFAEETPLERRADFLVGQFFVYKRPHLQEFIKFCTENFEVAVWTSSTRNYATKIVEEIFPNANELVFFWSRERCTQSFDAENYAYFHEKKMSKVRRCGYDLKKVIVVDDSPEKWRNSYGNLVRVKPFFGETDDSELKRLIIYLERLKSVENIRKTEKRNWQNRI
jgi:TFIIF-interacting CTD phosphatase-like protein